MLPIIPISILQSLICYIASIFLGLTIKIDILYALLMVIPISIFYTSLGLLCGSLLNVKQVGGICGALLTNLSAWLSGVWFDLNLVGGFFAKISNFLPFVHFVELQRAIINQTFIEALPHLYIVLIYALVTLIASILVFLIKRKRY
jgi:ABC-2 type transport system permease protein